MNKQFIKFFILVLALFIVQYCAKDDENKSNSTTTPLATPTETTATTPPVCETDVYPLAIAGCGDSGTGSSGYSTCNCSYGKKWCSAVETDLRCCYYPRYSFETSPTSGTYKNCSQGSGYLCYEDSDCKPPGTCQATAAGKNCMAAP